MDYTADFDDQLLITILIWICLEFRNCCLSNETEEQYTHFVSKHKHCTIDIVGLNSAIEIMIMRTISKIPFVCQLQTTGT